MQITVGIITVSDRASEGAYDDLGGPALKEAALAKGWMEMEALTGVSVALLTIYDMCKAVDKQMRIGEMHLVSKTKKRQDLQD